MSQQFEIEDYTIAWICALPVEGTAAIAVLDKRHPRLAQADSDDNAYEFGQIGSFNVIIAFLPSGIYGVTEAAKVVVRMRASFPYLTVGLMVGIGGGAPLLPQNDIRLGDVVVSEPSGGYGGVLQYDFGKTVQGGKFIQTGVLNKPPGVLLKAIAKLKSECAKDQYVAVNTIIEDAQKSGAVSREFRRPPVNSDRLFQAEYEHTSKAISCKGCDAGRVVDRPIRSVELPYVHYGLIASANQVMKHGLTRDKLSKETGVLCFEMEAAGLMDELPSLIIRGICDYSDTHKNKMWQPYAALAAAAYARNLLLQLPASAIKKKSRSKKVKLDLAIAQNAIFGSYADQEEPECLPGTRVELLDQILKWSEDPQGKCIFRLAGMAGTGKSTIARTVARTLKAEGRLGASFFFTRAEADRSGGMLFVTTIAVQLAEHFDEMAAGIQKIVEADPTISRKALKEQFDKIIFQPLSNLPVDGSDERKTLVIVVDALDECERREDISIIIYLLGQLRELRAVNLRVLLTSRPDMPIRMGFKKISEDTYQELILQDVPNIHHDITLFLNNEFVEIRSLHGLPDDWPGEEIVEQLVDMAVPLFIYAKTLSRFIGDEYFDPDEQIQAVLEYQPSWQESKLDNTYLPVLNQLVVGRRGTEKEKLIKEFKEVVGTIVTLADPLSIESLARLISLSETTVELRLKPLNSVLNIPNDRRTPVRTFHLSFRDFLVDRELSRKSDFWVDEQAEHMKIAARCIKMMYVPNQSAVYKAFAPSGLKRNICQLESPGVLRSEIDKTTIDRYISPEIQYACRFWIHHLKRSGNSITDESQAYKFLQVYLLRWLEAISLLGQMTRLFNMISALKSMLDPNDSKSFSEFLRDIQRFVSQNQSIIGKAPLQTYSSALIFTPNKSPIRNLFDPKRSLPWITSLPHVEDEWSEAIQTLEGHTDSVEAVEFSPDGKMIASAAEDATIKLWDSESGLCIQTLTGHEDSIYGLSFSSDGKILASASYDGCTSLWEASSGILIRNVEDCSAIFYILIISSDGDILTSASYDMGEESWTTISGDSLQPLDFPVDTTRALISCPRAFLLRWIPYGDAVKLWNSCSSSSASQLVEFLVSSWESLTLSADGKLVAVASKKDIIIRDLVSGTTRTFNGYLDIPIKSMAFSPDNKLLASGYNDSRHTIKLCDVASQKLIHSFKGHEGTIHALAFSKDGKILASASKDRTVRLWDVESKSNLDVVKIPQKFAFTARFLAETGKFEGWIEKVSKNMRSSSNSANSELFWDSRFPKSIGRWAPNRHERYVTGVVFSPNGHFMASGSTDGTVRLWNTSTGTTIRIYGQGLARNLGRLVSQLRMGGWYHPAISFSEDGMFLEIKDKRYACPVVKESDDKKKNGDIKYQPLKLDIQKDWITRGGKKVLWLPANRRQTCSDINGDMVVIGHGSGQVSLIRFDLSPEASLI